MKVVYESKDSEIRTPFACGAISAALDNTIFLGCFLRICGTTQFGLDGSIWKVSGRRLLHCCPSVFQVLLVHIFNNYIVYFINKTYILLHFLIIAKLYNLSTQMT